MGLLLTAAIPGRADLIYSLFTDGPWIDTSNSVRLAQSFSTGSAPMTLTSVSVWIRNESNFTRSMTLDLYSADVNNKPGSFLTSIFTNFSAEPWYDSTSNGNTVNSSLSFSLSANTTYLLVMRGNAEGGVGWKYPNDAPIPSPTSSISPTPTFYNWISTDSGSTWSDAAPTTGFNAVINASAAAVPEPGTWAAAALLAGGAAFARWRKRTKSA